MQANTILTADILDIIFDERNKAYGAYDLRKHYRERLLKAVLVMLAVVVLLFIAYLVAGSMKPKGDRLLAGPDIKLDAAPVKEKKPEIIITPPVKQELPKVKTIALTVPKIVDDPPEDQKVPEITEVEHAKIAAVTSDGKDDDGFITPPVDERKGIADAPKKQDGNDPPFTSVEIESQYPGGLSAWAAFLNRNLTYPEPAVEKGIEGTVWIQFVVDDLGNVSNVIAIGGPEELRATAVGVIKKSGKWTPGIQNGQKVKSYKKQPIVFKLENG
jgi:protein TonB